MPAALLAVSACIDLDGSYEPWPAPSGSDAGTWEDDLAVDDGIDRRTCEHDLEPLASFAASSAIRLASLGETTFVFVVDPQNVLSWARLSEASRLEVEGWLDVSCEPRLFAPCQRYLWVSPLSDERLMLMSLDDRGAVVYVLGLDGILTGPFYPDVPLEPLQVPLEVLDEAGDLPEVYEAGRVRQVVPIDDGVAVLVSRVVRYREQDYTLGAESLELVWLEGLDGEFAVRSGPHRLVDDQGSGIPGFPVAELAELDGRLLLVYGLQDETPLADFLSDDGGLEGRPFELFEGTPAGLARVKADGRLFLGAVAGGRIQIVEVDGAGLLDRNRLEPVHPDGRPPMGPLHLAANQGMLVASLLAGREDDYVFQVLRFEPDDGQVESAGVVAFSGGRLKVNLAQSTSNRDEAYLFGRTIQGDDGAVQLLRGRCEIDYE